MFLRKPSQCPHTYPGNPNESAEPLGYVQNVLHVRPRHSFNSASISAFEASLACPATGTSRFKITFIIARRLHALIKGFGYIFRPYSVSNTVAQVLDI